MKVLIDTPRYHRGEIISLSTDKYAGEALPQESPGEIINVSGRSGTFTYEVEVVTQNEGYPRVTKTFREEDLKKLPPSPNEDCNATGTGRKEDWRKQVQGVSVSRDTLLPGTDQIARMGSQIDIVSNIQLSPAEINIKVVVPNGTAILLSASRKAWQQAIHIRTKNNVDETGEFLTVQDSIDYQENVVIAVITAFAGLEAFINEMIPEDACFEDRNDERIVPKNKHQIEKNMSVLKKLDKVLPDMLNTSSPKGIEPIWSKFKKLKALRNRIIHMSSADRVSSTPDSPNLWHQIFSIECPYQAALQIIDFFFDKSGAQPRWRENWPFDNNKSVPT